jgi:hypothetical protein
MAEDAKPPAPEPGSEVPAAAMISVDARRVVLTGSVAFTLCFLALTPFWSILGSHHHRIWLWTCLAGAVLGFISLPLIERHKRAGRLG